VAAGITLDTNANPWVISFTASAAAGFTLPFALWPAAGYIGPISPCIVQRWVWIAGDSAVAGNKIVITDASGNGNEFLRLTATGADYEPPQEWKRQRNEGAPYGAIITEFDAGILYAYL
jgi:hypothetical protein